MENINNNFNWYELSANPNAISIMEGENINSMEDIDLDGLSIDIIRDIVSFIYDYEAMRETRGPIKEELMTVMFHPKNINKFESWGFY